MEEIRFPFRRLKTKWFDFLLALFFVAGFIALVISLVIKFHFLELVLALILGFLSYLGFINIFHKDQPGQVYILSDKGFAIENPSNNSHLFFKWNEINSVQVDASKIQRQKKLNIARTINTIEVFEETVDDFNEFSARVQEYFEKWHEIVEPEEEKRTPQIIPQYANITDEDVSAIRMYSHQLAVEWWQENNADQAACDNCNRPLSKGQGFLIGTWLYCVSCVSTNVFDGNALNHLSADPNFFGRGMLERARDFSKKQ